MLVRSFVKWGWAPLWWARGGLQLMWSQAAVSLGRRHKMALARNSARPQDNDTEIIRTSSPAPSHHNNIGYWWDSAAVMINSRCHDDVLFSLVFLLNGNFSSVEVCITLCSSRFCTFFIFLTETGRHREMFAGGWCWGGSGAKHRSESEQPRRKWGMLPPKILNTEAFSLKQERENVVTYIFRQGRLPWVRGGVTTSLNYL